MLPDFAGDLLGQFGAPVVHGQQDRRDLEIGIEVTADEVDVAEELTEAFECVVLALDRDEDLDGRDERVDGEQPERRRAVDEDVVDRIPRVHSAAEVGVQGTLEAGLAGNHGHELDLRAGQVDRRGHADKPGQRGDRDRCVLEGDSVDEGLIDRGHPGVVRDVERRGRVALRIKVDEEDAEPVDREGSGKIDRRSRLADAAFLVCDRHPPGRRRAGVGLRMAESDHCGRCCGDGGVRLVSRTGLVSLGSLSLGRLVAVRRRVGVFDAFGARRCFTSNRLRRLGFIGF